MLYEDVTCVSKYSDSTLLDLQGELTMEDGIVLKGPHIVTPHKES